MIAWLSKWQKSSWQFLTRRSTRYGANTLLILFLVLGILGFVNILAKNFNLRKDLSIRSENSLSPQTKKILGDLKQKVVVKFFYQNKVEERDRMERVLKAMAYESGKFRFEMIDPIRQPGITQALGVKDVNTAVIQLEDGSGRQVKVGAASEEKIVNGLIRLSKLQSQVLYFVTGHNEPLLQKGGKPNESIADLKVDLEAAGYSVKELNLIAEGKIPTDASVVAIAGPHSSFLPKEVELIAAWVKDGGNTFVALDLDLRDGGLSSGSKQMAALLGIYGLKFSDGLLVDASSQMGADKVQAGRTLEDHPIIKDFPISRQTPPVVSFLFPLSSSIKVNPGAVSAEFKVTEIVTSTKYAWEESDWKKIRSGTVKAKSPSSTPEMKTLGVTVESYQGKKSRLVAFATSAFVNDALLKVSGNRDLVLNTFAWLTGDDAFISIRAQDVNADDLIDFKVNWVNYMLIFFVAALPLLILLVGLFNWYRRKGR